MIRQEETPLTAHRPLTHALHAEAVRRGLLSPGAPLPDARTAFSLVRDMPYARASSHAPEVVIAEWRGTCSTKHELLAALLAESGLRSTLMACTQEIRPPPGAPPELVALAEGRPVVDVHNYLVVHAPEGDTIVDATWPLAARSAGLPVNDAFEPGRNMRVAAQPIETWAVPSGVSLVEFKDRLLRERYTPEELALRDRFIEAVGRLFLAR